MPKFFVDKEQILDEEIVISGDDARHIARSLRMAEGDELTVSDGDGTEYVGRLTKIRDEECRLAVTQRQEGRAEMPVEVTLFMAYPKADKLELVVQKATELGVRHIVPFESSRCVKRPKADKAEKVTARLNRIALEAAKQCGRSRVPDVSDALDLISVARLAARSDMALFCYEGAERRDTVKRILNERGADVRMVSVIVGCEGGFSPEEAKAFCEAGCLPVSLGERILRCETAPVYALSAISYHYEL